MSSSDSFHPYAWSAWLAAAALPALLTRNPLYLSLTLLAAGVVYAALGQRSILARNWGAFVRFSALLWLLTIPFVALLNHHGTLVLVRLPANWPLVGGPITAEALLYGLTGGLALLALLLVFAAFNVAVDQARLLRLTPVFVYQAGVVAGIAVAFVPQMVATWAAIREAQQVRGHRVRGVRDLLPLLLPLVITALERAMQLAESMEARGFGGPMLATAAADRVRLQLVMLAGLGSLSAGVVGLGFWSNRPWLVGAFLACGAALLLWSFWDQGRRVRRSRYQRWTWGRDDRIIMAVSLVAGIIWLVAMLVSGDLLFYYPYPPYSPWPTFEPLLGMAILLLVTPALIMARNR
jgi:energy-coupling factor transport system permease protein